MWGGNERERLERIEKVVHQLHVRSEAMELVALTVLQAHLLATFRRGKPATAVMRNFQREMVECATSIPGDRGDAVVELVGDFLQPFWLMARDLDDELSEFNAAKAPRAGREPS